MVSLSSLIKYTEEQKHLFYDMLLGKEEVEEEKEEEESLCLITNKPLDENHIQMECGHKFNYEPLYRDLMNHKNKFNMLEKNILATMELRCPYCRNVQKNLIPYKELPGIEKIHGVNFFDETKCVSSLYSKHGKNHQEWHKGKCSFTTTYQHIDGTSEVVTCKKTYVTFIDLLNNDYCVFHKYKAIQLHVKQTKEAKKAEKKAAKEAEKAAKAASVVFCKTILKTGKNKGNECGCRVYQEGKCRRHCKTENIVPE